MFLNKFFCQKSLKNEFEWWEPTKSTNYAYEFFSLGNPIKVKNCNNVSIYAPMYIKFDKKKEVCIPLKRGAKNMAGGGKFGTSQMAFLPPCHILFLRTICSAPPRHIYCTCAKFCPLIIFPHSFASAPFRIFTVLLSSIYNIFI